MFDRTNVIYCYDGTFNGILCCVYESLENHLLPYDILPPDSLQMSLMEQKIIETDPKKAMLVRKHILTRYGKDCTSLVKTAFLSGYDEKAAAIFDFLLLMHKFGAKSYNMLQNEVAAKIHAISKAVSNEAHLMKEFLRFGEYNGGLAAVIEPKNFVLPLIKGHFCSRFPEEHFLIYDEAHEMALMYKPYKSVIIDVEDFALPPADENEIEMRRLWTGYFEAIAIKERINPVCQRGHMPKRFWKNMTEMQGLEKWEKEKGKIDSSLFEKAAVFEKTDAERRPYLKGGIKPSEE